jgi:uncharacterized membrane protein
MFILLAGYSVHMTYKKDNKIHLKKRAARSLEILIHGLFITCLTFFLYPNNFIRFGILHFLAISTLLISGLAPYKIVSVIVLIISVFAKYPSINTFVDTITGANAPASMMDWFPLDKWMPIILSGLVIGQNLDISKLNNIEKNIETNFDKILNNSIKIDSNNYKQYIIISSIVLLIIILIIYYNIKYNND